MRHWKAVSLRRFLSHDGRCAAALPGLLIKQHAETSQQARQLIGFEQVQAVARATRITKLVHRIALIQEKTARFEGLAHGTEKRAVEKEKPADQIVSFSA